MKNNGIDKLKSSCPALITISIYLISSLAKIPLSELDSTKSSYLGSRTKVLFSMQLSMISDISKKPILSSKKPRQQPRWLH